MVMVEVNGGGGRQLVRDRAEWGNGQFTCRLLQ